MKKQSKNDEWNKVRAELNKIYSHIEFCELRFPGCMRTFGLAWAHSKKRNHIALSGEERHRELREAVKACQYCHNLIEYPKPEQLENEETGKEYMYRQVITAINRRQND